MNFKSFKALEPTQKHFKMYKDGKRWVVAGIFPAAVGMGGLMPVNVSADVTPAEQTVTSATATTNQTVPIVDSASNLTVAATSVASTASTSATENSSAIASDELSSNVSDQSSQSMVTSVVTSSSAVASSSISVQSSSQESGETSQSADSTVDLGVVDGDDKSAMAQVTATAQSLSAAHIPVSYAAVLPATTSSDVASSVAPAAKTATSNVASDTQVSQETVGSHFTAVTSGATKSQAVMTTLTPAMASSLAMMASLAADSAKTVAGYNRSASATYASLVATASYYASIAATNKSRSVYTLTTNKGQQGALTFNKQVDMKANWTLNLELDLANLQDMNHVFGDFLGLTLLPVDPKVAATTGNNGGGLGIDGVKGAFAWGLDLNANNGDGITNLANTIAQAGFRLTAPENGTVIKAGTQLKSGFTAPDGTVYAANDVVKNDITYAAGALLPANINPDGTAMTNTQAITDLVAQLGGHILGYTSYGNAIWTQYVGYHVGSGSDFMNHSVTTKTGMTADNFATDVQTAGSNDLGTAVTPNIVVPVTISYVANGDGTGVLTVQAVDGSYKQSMVVGAKNVATMALAIKAITGDSSSQMGVTLVDQGTAPAFTLINPTVVDKGGDVTTPSTLPASAPSSTASSSVSSAVSESSSAASSLATSSVSVASVVPATPVTPSSSARIDATTPKSEQSSKVESHQTHDNQTKVARTQLTEKTVVDRTVANVALANSAVTRDATTTVQRMVVRSAVLQKLVAQLAHTTGKQHDVLQAVNQLLARSLPQDSHVRVAQLDDEAVVIEWATPNKSVNGVRRVARHVTTTTPVNMQSLLADGMKWTKANRTDTIVGEMPTLVVAIAQAIGMVALTIVPLSFAGFRLGDMQAPEQLPVADLKSVAMNYAPTADLLAREADVPANWADWGTTYASFLDEEPADQLVAPAGTVNVNEAAYAERYADAVIAVDEAKMLLQEAIDDNATTRSLAEHGQAVSRALAAVVALNEAQRFMVAQQATQIADGRVTYQADDVWSQTLDHEPANMIAAPAGFANIDADDYEEAYIDHVLLLEDAKMALQEAMDDGATIGQVEQAVKHVENALSDIVALNVSQKFQQLQQASATMNEMDGEATMEYNPVMSIVVPDGFTMQNQEQYEMAYIDQILAVDEAKMDLRELLDDEAETTRAQASVVNAVDAVARLNAAQLIQPTA
ncbi:lectin-like domain-containing protein [Weissella cibaria]|uniref:KxYKxGKxW signal peptide n=2 Tax=Weissella cibaria TaxID=137591 RepID=A0A0D1LZG2_9LACO|nr:KxYKxGKxW signal peptide domain-containing protein [Weissella cibaria]KIU21156.1 KxYKxGKxW signal peptide [Weissella cibaria]MDV8929626.1 KxYKxGKxW signal peptide domain-containing protein [Weissella cibaria]